MTVECEVDHIEITNERGHEQEGVRVDCGRCEHHAESFGSGEASVRRCLVRLRETCPLDERNFYVGTG